MKKNVMAAMILGLSLGLTACGGDEADVVDEVVEKEDVEISLWTYPVGNWSNPSTVAGMLTDFNQKYPNIHVSVDYLTYEDGDAKINEAIDRKTAPDLVFEGPERLVADWGSRGVMVDLTDVWETEGTAGEIYDNVRAACRHSNGEYYEFPVCMTAHCMAINYDMFAAADALQYIDEENRTWTTEDFKKAVEALVAYGQENVGVVYCGGQGGDQGTRALITNLYGGAFTNPEHTEYTVNNPENVKALEFLRDLDGISFAPDIVGGDEVKRFTNGELAMAFCWNASLELTQTLNNPNLNFEIMPMTFPTDSGEPKLQGGIWGFGIFDNGDEAKIEAAKTFIKFITEDETEYSKAVIAAAQFPARSGSAIYANDEFMNEYSMFMRYMGDYYQVTPNWANARTAWWNMLQSVGSGSDVAEALSGFDAEANKGTGASAEN